MAENEGRKPRTTRTRKGADIVPLPERSDDMPAEVSGPASGPIGIIERARDAITVKRVFGDPIRQGDVTIVPAAHVRGGGGGGSGQGPNGEGGGGFGVSSSPAGAYVIKNGSVTWQPALDLNRTIFMGQVVAIVALLTLRSVVKAIAKRR